MDIVYWDHGDNAIIALNLAIVVGLFASLRLFSGAIAHINASDELLKKDNPAFGVSLAGVAFAITILLSGTIYGYGGENFLNSAVSIGLFGIIGIMLMALTRIIFDRFALPHISLRDEIVKGNMAVAIVDTANVIAAALILRAVMMWIPDNTIETLVALLVMYAISQFILTGTTFVRLKFFKMMYPERSIEAELKNGNVALALSFAGGKIMAAFAITLASQLIIYEYHDTALALIAWAVVSIIFIGILKILSVIAERIILFKVSIGQEVLEQKNTAIGAIQAVIQVAMGILLAGL